MYIWYAGAVISLLWIQLPYIKSFTYHLCFHFVCLHSEESEETELNSHESAVVKTMIKGPAATQGKHYIRLW